MAVKPAKPSADAKKAMKELAAADQRVSFGPLFFMQNLRGLVRDRCPDPKEEFPSVQIHLMDGQSLDLCHIIGVAPNWIALAVHEEEHADAPSPLRTEMVPYHLIARISIESNRHEGAHPIGFNTQNEPEVFGGAPIAGAMTPEEALKAVAGVPPEAPPAARDTPPTASKRSR
ncbi:MAG TPA: hypothetical protein VFU59_09075 [Candidatus Eisenbacteria bacterium]|nr:hypothetical protein [Candidatus Eisenbacteria bacterium]